MAGNFPMNVYNNMIVNNVSTHEGGGIALDDAPNVRVFNNTIMKNLTTATAVTSDGRPAPAGLSTVGQQRPAAGDAAGRLARLQQPAAVQQHLLGQPGGHAGRHHGHRHRPGRRRHARSTTGTWASADGHRPAGADELDHPAERRARTRTRPVATNSVGRPGRRRRPTTSRCPSRPGARTRRSSDATLVTVEAPPEPAGRLPPGSCPGSPACNLGAASKAVPAYQQPPAGLAAPTLDVDDQARPGPRRVRQRRRRVRRTRHRRPPPTHLYFSTSANTNPPGVGGTADDADIYLWNGTAFSR